MAEKSAQEAVLPLAKLKSLLRGAESGSIGCALALSSDKKGAVLLIDRKLKARGLAAMMKREHKDDVDLASLRFGECEIQADAPNTVRFTLNKAASGSIATQVGRLIKKSGYQEVVFNVDEALEAAPEDAVEPATPGNVVEPATPGNVVEPATPGNVVEPATPAASAAPDQPALKARLVKLVQDMPKVLAASPEKKDELVKLAKDAQAALGSGDLVAVGTQIQALEDAMNAAGAGASGDGGARASTAFAACATAWRDCTSEISGKIDQLKSALLDAYADEPEVLAEVRGGLGTIDAALAGLDNRLEDTLNKAAGVQDPAQQKEMAQRTKAIIADYIKFVAADKQIVALDENPLGVPMGLRPMLISTLNSMVGLTKSMQ